MGTTPVEPTRRVYRVCEEYSDAVEYFTPSTSQHCNQRPAICSCYTCRLGVVARRPGDVSERSVPAAAKGDGAPDSEDPALIKKMRNQHTKPGRVMPVRAHHGCRAVP